MNSYVCPHQAGTVPCGGRPPQLRDEGRPQPEGLGELRPRLLRPEEVLRGEGDESDESHEAGEEREVLRLCEEEGQPERRLEEGEEGLEEDALDEGRSPGGREGDADAPDAALPEHRHLRFILERLLRGALGRVLSRFCEVRVAQRTQALSLSGSGVWSCPRLC